MYMYTIHVHAGWQPSELWRTGKGEGRYSCDCHTGQLLTRMRTLTPPPWTHPKVEYIKNYLSSDRFCVVFMPWWRLEYTSRNVGTFVHVSLLLSMLVYEELLYWIHVHVYMYLLILWPYFHKPTIIIIMCCKRHTVPWPQPWHAGGTVSCL